MQSNLQAVYKGIKLQNSPMVMHVIVRNDSVFHTYLLLIRFQLSQIGSFTNGLFIQTSGAITTLFS